MPTTATLNANWGTLAAVTLNGNDTRGFFRISPGGTGVKGNATVTLTFGTAFTNPPYTYLIYYLSEPHHWDFSYTVSTDKFVLTFRPAPLTVDHYYGWYYYCLAP